MSAVGGGGSAVTVRTSVKAGHAAWPGQVMPADLTPNSSHNSSHNVYLVSAFMQDHKQLD